MKRLLPVLFLLFTLQLTAQSDYTLVSPQKGEGLLKLLRRNKVDVKHKAAFIELNKGNFGKNESLIAGKQYKLLKSWVDKPKEEWRSYPIFGKEYERLKIIDRSLQGAVFYLVAGHGGPDPGAVGKHDKLGDLCEDEYAYDVTLRLAKWLIERDALVYFIVRDDDDGIRDDDYLACDTDEYAYTRGAIPRNQVERLEQRTDIVNNLYKKHKGSKFQRMVAIHVDSRGGEDIDVYFYYHENSRRGKKLARDIYNTMENKYKTFQPNRGYKGAIKQRSSLYVLKNTNPAAVFIELGNIVSPRDQKRIISADNRQALAKWIGEGLLKNYKEK